MTNKQSQISIRQLEGTNAVLILQSQQVAIKERLKAIRLLLRKGGYCQHFKTADEIILGISKLLSQTQHLSYGYYIANWYWATVFKTGNMYSMELIHAFSLLIADIVQKENPLESYYFCEELDGKYNVVIRYFDTKVEIERELEYYLNTTERFPTNFQEFSSNLHVYSKTFINPPSDVV